MSNIKFHASKFVIIDLVPDSEMQTGRHIEENLNDFILVERSNLSCNRYKCASETDFFSIINQVKTDLVNKGEVPYIHIEGHGSKEALFFPEGSKIEWSSVFESFREVNILSKNNLFFSSGACESAYAYKSARITEPCPVFGLLAPEEEVTAGDVSDGFIAFFKSLIKSENLNEAFAAFASATDGKKYALIFSPLLFKKAAYKYLTEHCMGAGRQRRLENIVSQAVVESGLSVNETRKRLKAELAKPQASQLSRLHHNFMMCNLYPENVNRFKFDAVKFELDVKNGKPIKSIE